MSLKRKKYRYDDMMTPYEKFHSLAKQRFFGLLTERQLRRGVFTSVQELEETIMDFIGRHNEDKKPFVWTKSAEEILKKVGRARHAL